MQIGGQNITAMYVGNQPVARVYLGSQLVWMPPTSGITLTPTTTGPVGVTGDPTVSFDVDVGDGGDVVGALVYFTWVPSGRYAVSATIDGVAAVDFERSHSSSTEQIVTFRATGVSAGTVTVTVTFNNTIINLDAIRGYAWTASGSITSAGTAIEATVDPFVDGVGLTVSTPMTEGQTAICVYRPASPYVGMTVTGATANSSGASGAPAIFAHYDATSALTQDINFVNATEGSTPPSANGTAVVFS